MNEHVVTVENVSFRSIDETGFPKIIINKISFEIEEGRITSLLGNNEETCSYLLKMAADIVKPNSGTVTKQKKTIFIPSRPSSFPWLNVEDNVLYNIKDYDSEKYKSIVKLVGLYGYENHFPDNDSFGFRFRIVVARTLMNDAEVLILNKPFAFMDALTKNECADLLKKIMREKKKTIVLSSTSIMESVDFSDVIFVLSDTTNGNLEKFICTEESRLETITKIGKILHK